MNYFLTDYGLLLEIMGMSIVHSLWQAAIIWITMVGVIRLFKIENPAIRFNALFFGQFTLLLTVVFTFCYLLSVSNSHGAESVLLTNSNLGVETNLLLQEASLITSLSYFGLISKIWLVGLVLFVGRMIVATIHFLFARRNTSPVQNNELKQLFEQLKIKLAVNSLIELKLSHQNVGPAVIGFVKPIVLLPFSIVNHLSLEETEYILMHELAHIKRNDHLTLLVQRLIETVLYFNPFVWFMSREMNKMREQSCDDIVLSQTSGKEVAYTKSLVRLHELIRSSYNPLQLSAVNKKGDLWHRVKRILTTQTKNEMNMKKVIIFLLIPIFFVLVSFGDRSGNQNEQIDSSEDNTFCVDEVIHTETDTIPISTRRIIRKEINNGVEEEIELEYEDENLKSLKINGEDIEEEHFGEYEEEINEVNITKMGKSKRKIYRFNEEKEVELDDGDRIDNDVIIIKRGKGKEDVEVRRRNNKTYKKAYKFEEDSDGNMTIKIDPNIGSFYLNGNGFSLSADDIKMNMENFEEHFDKIKKEYKDSDVFKEFDINMYKNAADQMIIDMNMSNLDEILEKSMEKAAESLKNIDNISSFFPGSFEVHEDDDHVSISIDTEDFYFPINGAKRGSKLQRVIAKELKRDHLIADTNAFKFKLKNGKLKVNGKRVSKHLTKKYIEIIEDYKGAKIGSGNTIEIIRKSK